MGIFGACRGGASHLVGSIAQIGRLHRSWLRHRAGVARGRADIPTILVIGDGGFLMTMGELETVVREDIPLVIIVMNDCAYGTELHFLRMRGLPEAKSVFPDVDYAPVATAFGFEARTIRTLEDLHAAATLPRNPQGPILLDCKLNADVAAPFMTEFYAFETGKH